MTDNTNTPVDNNSDDLDAFERVFFSNEDEQSSDPKAGEELNEEVEEDEIEDDHLAPEDDEDEEDSSTEEDELEEEEEEPQPRKRNRKSAKERIEELVSEARIAQREASVLRAELAQIKTQKTEVQPKEETVSLSQKLPPEAPKPDAVTDEGEPVYPLGEFDPMFIRDITRFTIKQENEAAEAAKQALAVQREMEAAQEAIKATWAENLEKVEEELPDIREKIGNLTKAFEGIEPKYGEYLASTLMSSEFGPQIMYYLSQNIGEAQKIVASGPAAATLAIGRLEAKFIGSTEQELKRNKKVSKAPSPPSERTRGSRGQFTIRSDTDDLDAFEREFYKRR